MSEERLEPCPFCGQTRSLELSHYRDGKSWWHYVECTECVMTGPVGRLKGDAVNAWNKREGGRHEG